MCTGRDCSLAVLAVPREWESPCEILLLETLILALILWLLLAPAFAGDSSGWLFASLPFLLSDI